MEFRVLGPLEIVVDGKNVDLAAAKPRALLAVLLLQAGRAVASDRLIEDLWAGRPPTTARKVLQSYVSSLRKALGADVLVTRPAGYELRVAREAVDLHRFERLVTEARAAPPEVAAPALREALDLWRGEPLAEFSYEPWAQAEIARLQELRLAAVQDRIEADLATGHAGELVGELERLVAEHPLSERLRGQLMLALYRAGRQADALAAYRDARTTLVETLGIEPGAALRGLERAILDQDPTLDRGVADAGRPLPMRQASSVREPSSSFVGRSRELREVRTLLRRADVRVLTLTGPGGTGKTRLAREAVVDLADEFPDGVVLVELASISDPELVATTVATELGLRDTLGRAPTEVLASTLRARRTLLVLDNFEHVSRAAPLLAELSAAAPDVTLLVTSRAPLELPAERVFPVPPLALPDVSRAGGLGRLRRSDAVRLFVERAREARPDFRLSEANAGAVAELCLRLDGLPLALELAAARVKLLSPHAILTRLGGRLELLRAAPSTGAPERHRTLRAATDWSYALLTEDEQSLFTSLSVFVGGFTLDGAEAVAGGGALDVVAGVESLLTNNLLRLEGTAADEPRFGMLRTIREYALTRLDERGDGDAVRRRYAAYYMALAETAEPALLGPDQVAWLARLDAELGNLRAVMSWSAESGEAETGLRAGAELWRFWQLRGLMAEARGVLEQLLETPTGSDRARAVARARVASLANMQGDWESARLHGEVALPDLRRLTDDVTVSTHLGILVLASLGMGRLEDARAQAEEAFELARRSGDATAQAYARNTLGAFLAQTEQLDEAEVQLAESVAMARRLGNVRSVAMWLRMLGNVALARGNREQARLCFEESLTVGQTLADPWVVSRALSRLALLALQAGDVAKARRLASESIGIEQEVGGEVGQLLNLEVLALAVAAEHPAHAAALYGRASVIRESVGTQDWPDRKPDLAGLRQALGEDAFAREWERGRQLSLDAALELALASDRDAPATARQGRTAS